jgi:thiol-disulfide isomerase/thioredoxin
MRALILTLLAIVPLPAQPNSRACEIQESNQARFVALPKVNDLSKSWEERIAPRRALAQAYPGDWALQIALQDPIRNAFFLGSEWDLALAHYRKLPDRALGELLEARLLSGMQRKQSALLLDKVEKAVPNSPWLHLARLEWHRNERINPDFATAAKHLLRFRELCPKDPRVFVHIDVVKDADQFAPQLRALRLHLEARKEAGLREEDLPLFRPAWTWESVLAAESGREAFEKQLDAELQVIRALDLFGSNDWANVLRFGHEKRKDKASIAALENEAKQREKTAGISTPWTTSLASAKVLQDPASTDEAVTEAAEAFLRAEARYPDQSMSVPPKQLQVAEVFVRRKIHLERVPELLKQGMAKIEDVEKYRRESDFMQPPIPALLDNIAFTRNRAVAIDIRHAIATGQPERIPARLAELRQWLIAAQPLSGSGYSLNAWNQARKTYLELAGLAALTVEPIPDAATNASSGGERFPVSDFTATDLNGRTWRLADLKDKVAYVNIWTTWCTPCRAEMPALEQLHQRWKDRKDRVVLTISADERPEVVRAFLKENGYSFPTIHGAPIAEKFFPPVSFPQNWLIDPTGKRLGAPAPHPVLNQLDPIDKAADALLGGHRP